MEVEFLRKGGLMSDKIIEMDGFSCVGVKWQGTYEQAEKGELKTLQEEFKRRISQGKGEGSLASVYGLARGNDGKGFIYYYLAKKEEDAQVPEGMVEVEIPSGLYAYADADGNVKEVYTELYKWIEENGYEAGRKEVSSLEVYPFDYDALSELPRLKVYIPVREKQKG